jgi:hypothetical protein
MKKEKQPLLVSMYTNFLLEASELRLNWEIVIVGPLYLWVLHLWIQLVRWKIFDKNCIDGVGRGLRGRDDGNNVTNEQYKSNPNCHYESLPV